MGVIYFMFMMIGVFSVRVPAEGWKPAGWTAAREAAAAGDLGPSGGRRRPGARRSSGCCGCVLCMNVTAGIGVLGQASPMIQEIFSGRVTAAGRRGLRRLDQPVQHGRPVLLGVHLRLHRPPRHLHGVLRARHRSVRGGADARPLGLDPRLFVAAFCIILSMYGGGFATIPAYLRDMFGTMHVGRDSRPAAHRLVGGRRARAGAGELHSPVPDRHTACRRHRPIRSPCTSCARCS